MHPLEIIHLWHNRAVEHLTLRHKSHRRFPCLWVLLVAAAVVAVWAVARQYGPGWVAVSDDADIAPNEEFSDIEVEIETPEYRQKYDYAIGKLSGLGELSDYIVVVDISEQKEYVFTKAGELVKTYTIATGSTSIFTDGSYQDRSMHESVWKVVSKRDSGLEPLYGPRLMMMDKWTGSSWMTTAVALHGTNTPEILGTPSSLGCVYHDNADIIELYDLIAVGTFVVAIP